MWDIEHPLVKAIECLPEGRKPIARAGVSVNNRGQKILNIKLGNRYNPYRFFLSQDEQRLLRAVPLDIPYHERTARLLTADDWRTYNSGGPYNMVAPPQWLQRILKDSGLLDTVVGPDGRDK